MDCINYISFGYIELETHRKSKRPIRIMANP